MDRRHVTGYIIELTPCYILWRAPCVAAVGERPCGLRSRWSLTDGVPFGERYPLCGAHKRVAERRAVRSDGRTIAVFQSLRPGLDVTP